MEPNLERDTSYSVGRRIRKTLSRLGFIVYIGTHMRLGLLLNLYQPITQEPEVFHKVYSECYLPLLKLLKSNKNISLTLNMPLSLLQQLDHYGYSSWISGVKELVESGRVEIVGSGAYHPILPKISKVFAEQEVTLNEYGLGYYFGKHTGFDGEKSIMIRDLAGFFPPEMAISQDTATMLDEFGYNWVVVENTSIKAAKEKENIYSKGFILKGSNLRLLVRDTYLSNLISFKSDTSVSDIISYIKESGLENHIVCMDGEFFGHHFKNGLFLLDFLIQECVASQISLVKVGEIAAMLEYSQETDICDSTWATTASDVKAGNFYPIWDIKGNEVHQKLWSLVSLITNHFSSYFSHASTLSDYETLAVWKPSELVHIKDEVLRKEISTNLLVNNFLNSDQFWWSSKQTINGTLYLDNASMVLRSLDIARDLSNVSNDPEFSAKCNELINEISSLL